MHGSRIPIWFFIGALLMVYGALILGYGIFEWITGNYPVGVQLTNLHMPVWWGAILELLGIVYVVRFRPGKETRMKSHVESEKQKASVS